jgi:hypothetical protein
VSDAIENFIAEFAKSLAADSFVKLTLSNYKGPEQHLQKVAARVIDTKRGRRLALQFHYETRQTVKNFDFDEAVTAVRDLLASGFRSGHLFTTANDFQLTVGKKSGRMISVKPTFNEKPSSTHDREKNSIVHSGAPYLKAIGITNDKGEIRKDQRDKWRQIKKYVEILGGLYENSSLPGKSTLKIVDMGSGKGYLTFAAYDYFANQLKLKLEMIGIDTRRELVDLCNQIADACGFDGLKFVTGTIADVPVPETDILIALHACDTATDDALFKGITSNAEIIVAAPCCHKEIRPQIKPPELLRDILKHGSMLEREAETITDGLRAMLLERSGYSTKIFEFVPTTHTPKNNMIAATRTGSASASDRIQERIDALKAFYGIGEQRLENLLA